MVAVAGVVVVVVVVAVVVAAAVAVEAWVVAVTAAVVAAAAAVAAWVLAVLAVAAEAIVVGVVYEPHPVIVPALLFRCPLIFLMAAWAGQDLAPNECALVP